MVQHAIACGALLKEVKGQLTHGAWEPWIKENFNGGLRKAQSYMQVAAKAQTSALLDDVDSMNQATKLIAVPRAPEVGPQTALQRQMSGALDKAGAEPRSAPRSGEKDSSASQQRIAERTEELMDEIKERRTEAFSGIKAESARRACNDAAALARSLAVELEKLGRSFSPA